MRGEIILLRSTFEESVERLRQGSGRLFLSCSLNMNDDHTKFLVNDLIVASEPPQVEEGHYIFELSRRRLRRSSERGTLCLGQDNQGHFIRGSFRNPKTGQLESIDVIKVIGFPMLFIPTDDGEIDSVPTIQRERDVLGNAATMISMLSCAVIGCGKTGFPIFTQLLDRVREIAVVDYQVVEEENLPFLGASESFLGLPKVEYFKVIGERSRTRVVSIFGDATDPRVLELLKSVDVIFLSCDRTLPRLVIAILGQQYLIPVIDVGVAVQAGGSGRHEMMAQVQIYIPGQGCIFCLRGFNLEQALRESMSPFEEELAQARRFLGQEGPHPAIKAFSSLVGLQAMLELDNLFSGLRQFHQFIRINGLADNPVSYLENARADPQCPVCGPHGILGIGDGQPLPDLRRVNLTVPEADGPSGQRGAGQSQSRNNASSTSMNMGNMGSNYAVERSHDTAPEILTLLILLLLIGFFGLMFMISVLITDLLGINVSMLDLFFFSSIATVVSAIFFFVMLWSS